MISLFKVQQDPLRLDWTNTNCLRTSISPSLSFTTFYWPLHSLWQKSLRASHHSTTPSITSSYLKRLAPCSNGKKSSKSPSLTLNGSNQLGSTSPSHTVLITGSWPLKYWQDGTWFPTSWWKCLLNPPLCWRGCDPLGTFLHILWSCNNIHSFWRKIFCQHSSCQYYAPQLPTRKSPRAAITFFPVLRAVMKTMDRLAQLSPSLLAYPLRQILKCNFWIILNLFFVL